MNGPLKLLAGSIRVLKDGRDNLVESKINLTVAIIQFYCI